MLWSNAKRRRGFVGYLLGAGVRCDMAGRVRGDHHWDMSGDDLWGSMSDG